MTEELRLKIENLPDSPGCYLMKRQGEIIYVGKAVNLKNRVRSYFHSPRGHTPKVAAMMGKVEDVDVMLCSTNLEALILNFEGASYTISRSAVESWYGVDLTSLQDADRWAEKVQRPLSDRGYVHSFIEENFK